MPKQDFASVNLRLFNDHLIVTTWTGAEYQIAPDAEGMESIMSILRVLSRKAAGKHTTQRLEPGVPGITKFTVRTFDTSGKETTLEDL